MVAQGLVKEGLCWQVGNGSKVCVGMINGCLIHLRAIASVIAKYKKCKNLHNIALKTPTSLFLNLCKYTNILQ